MLRTRGPRQAARGGRRYFPLSGPIPLGRVSGGDRGDADCRKWRAAMVGRGYVVADFACCRALAIAGPAAEMSQNCRIRPGKSRQIAWRLQERGIPNASFYIGAAI